jgi:leucyl aminopeptidase (aminopeptidase T)
LPVFDINDFSVLRDVRSIRVLAQQERLAMLRLLAEKPLTGSMVARSLHMDAPRAHYHLRQLLAAGLIRELPQERRGQTDERYFAASARHYLVDPRLACQDDETSTALLQAIDHSFGEWRRREVLAIDYGEIARLAVIDSLCARPGERVLVMFGPGGMELAEAITVQLEAIGAIAVPKLWSLHGLLCTIDRHTKESLAALPFLRPDEDEGLGAVVFVSSYVPQGKQPTGERREKLQLRLEAVSRWRLSLRERRIRYLEVPLPQRGEFEGGWVTPEEAIDTFWRCLRADRATLRARAAAVIARARDARQVVLECPRGSRLSIAIDPDVRDVSDGVISDDDVLAGRTAESLTAGAVSFLPLAEGTHGVLVADYAYAVGRHFRNLQIEIRDGRIASLDGEGEIEELRARIEGAVGDPDLIAEVHLGLNPGGGAFTGKFMLDACMAGAVTVTFGNNEMLGGKVRSTLHLWAPSRVMTLHAGRSLLVREGRLETT